MFVNNFCHSNAEPMEQRNILFKEQISCGHILYDKQVVPFFNSPITLTGAFLFYSLILIGDFPFYLFIYLFIFWQQLQNTSLFGHLDAFKRTIHFESISSFLHAPSIAHTVTGRFDTTSAKLFLLF